MKKYVIILVILFPVHIMAQVGKMLGEQTAWVYDRSSYSIGDTHGTYVSQTFFELLPNDTIVDGIVYRNLIISEMYFGSKETTFDDEQSNLSVKHRGNLYRKYIYDPIKDDPIVVLLREEDNKVFIQKKSYIEYLQSNHPEVYPRQTMYLTDDNSEDQILYDFSLQVGDKYPILGDVKVIGIEEVETKDGVVRKLFHLSNEMDILEGIGCIDCAGQLIAYQSLDKYAMDDEYYYNKSFSIEFYPNGLNEQGYSFDYINTRIDNNYYNANSDITIFDLQGRRITERPQKGIYIENGRKKIVK